MPTQACEVSIVVDGQRHSLLIENASSTYDAAFRFLSRVVGHMAPGIPRPTKETVYEVRVIETGKVYRVTDAALWAWGNRVAERRNRRG